MITVVVFFENGDYFHTGFNGTFEEARGYYLGRKFELDENKPMVKVVEVLEVGKK